MRYWLAAVLLLAGCASTYIGVGIQKAQIQMDLVVEATKEAIKMHALGKLSDQDFVILAGRYNEWAKDERELALALADWRTVSSSENTARVNAALEAVGRSTQLLLNLLEKMGVDIQAVGARLKSQQGVSLPQPATRVRVVVGLFPWIWVELK